MLVGGVFISKSVNFQQVYFNLIFTFMFSTIFFNFSEYWGMSSELFDTFVHKFLSAVSNIDTNLYLIYVVVIAWGWVLQGKLINFLRLIVVLLVFEVKLLESLKDSKQLWDTVNNNLLNGVFYTHPLILVLMIVATTQLIFFKKTYTESSFFKKMFNIGALRNLKPNLILVLTFLLLITGSWWAQQELNWGGWWAWDFVEFANLNIFIFFLAKRHNTSLFRGIRSYGYAIISSLLIVYVYTRYNLIPSIHSFLSETSFLQYDYFVYIVLTVYILTIFLFFLYRLKAPMYLSLRSYKYYLLHGTFKLISLGIIFTLIITVGFNSLGVFSIKALQYLTVLLLATTLFIGVRPNIVYFCLLFINPLCVTVYALVYRFYIIWRALTITHLLVFFLLTVSLLSWSYVDLLFSNDSYNNLNTHTSIYLKSNLFMLSWVEFSQVISQNIGMSGVVVSNAYLPQDALISSFTDHFMLNYIDSYFSTTQISFVIINRTVLIYYFYYYLTSLFLLSNILLISYLTYLVRVGRCFFIRFKSLNKVEQSSFKKRYKLFTKLNTHHVEQITLQLLKQSLFEGVYYVLLRKFFKKLLKRKRTGRVWIFLKANYPISKKSKNSRMGKGIGSFLRWSYRLRPNFKLIYVSKINYTSILKIKSKLSNVIGRPVGIYTHNFYK